jgi:hypothetical protein
MPQCLPGFAGIFCWNALPPRDMQMPWDKSFTNFDKNICVATFVIAIMITTVMYVGVCVYKLSAQLQESSIPACDGKTQTCESQSLRWLVILIDFRWMIPFTQARSWRFTIRYICVHSCVSFNVCFVSDRMRVMFAN